MGLNTWNKLSKENQELIYQATEEAGNYEISLTQEQLNTAMIHLKGR